MMLIYESYISIFDLKHQLMNSHFTHDHHCHNVHHVASTPAHCTQSLLRCKTSPPAWAPPSFCLAPITSTTTRSTRANTRASRTNSSPSVYTSKVCSARETWWWWTRAPCTVARPIPAASACCYTLPWTTLTSQKHPLPKEVNLRIWNCLWKVCDSSNSRSSSTTLCTISSNSSSRNSVKQIIGYIFCGFIRWLMLSLSIFKLPTSWIHPRN